MRSSAKQSRITISAQPAVIDSPVVSTDHEDHPRTPTLAGAGSPPPTLSNASVHIYNTTAFRIDQQIWVRTTLSSPHSAPFAPKEQRALKKLLRSLLGGALKGWQGQGSRRAQSLLLEGVADPTPYTFRPNSSANLIANNAKDLDALQQMGSAGLNIAPVVIAFVTAVASSTESSVLTSVQLLWMNIIITDTFAALALATDPASRDVLDRVADHMPDRKTAPSFNTAMRI
ncbi:hypothetical protein FRC05_006959 [Tulasnella sp. 425]|nr:hypothetical protein FRC05_006959 [Tulasnella sp. 425]